MDNQVKCKVCNKLFINDSEEYYWHFKIENAEIERSLLFKQFGLVDKQIKLLESPESERTG